MQEKTLFLKIFQPFAQYRNPFTFYYAQTYPLPPKSTIIGMLQNACDDWYGNKKLEEWWNLKVSVHGGFESVFWNYQSLIKGELGVNVDGVWINRNDGKLRGNMWLPLYGEGIASQRTPVYQQELFNGHLYIFIRGDEHMIDCIKNSLEHPKKVLSLGRSEDIIFIEKENVKEIEPIEIKSVEETIWLTFPTYIIDEIKLKNKKYPVYTIPIKVVFKNKKGYIKHKSEIFKDTEQNVDFKVVLYTRSDYVIYLNDKLDVEEYKIDDKIKFKIVNPYGWL
ncbi:MAG: type I-B CRISPR-associated protein Cas5b [Nanopusillaceae archaeon]